MNSAQHHEYRRGLLAALAALFLWGVFPLFWNLLAAVPALEVVGHRVVWSFLFLAAALPWTYGHRPSIERQKLRHELRAWMPWVKIVAAAFLILLNWLTFVWAVSNDQVLEASLGYYINPLLNVALGVILLGERLSWQKWAAIALAAAGVVALTITSGKLPWVSLVLACSFSLYSLVKKKTQLPPLLGLFMETVVLILPGIVYLVFLETGTGGVIGQLDLWILTLLMLGGTVTIAPLAFFAYAAQRVPLSTLGILQYMAPTMQLLIGIFFMGEQFDFSKTLGFSCVWIAVALFIASSRSPK